MKMPFLLISPKIVPKIQLIKKGGCFEYHAVIADKIKYRYVHRASICPALGMDRRSFARCPYEKTDMTWWSICDWATVGSNHPWVASYQRICRVPCRTRRRIWPACFINNPQMQANYPGWQQFYRSCAAIYDIRIPEQRSVIPWVLWWNWNLCWLRRKAFQVRLSD